MPDEVLSPPTGLLEINAILSLLLALASGINLMVIADPARFASESPALTAVVVEAVLFLVGIEIGVLNSRLSRGVWGYYPMYSFLPKKKFHGRLYVRPSASPKTQLPRVFLKVKDIPVFLSLPGLFLLLALLRIFLIASPVQDFLDLLLVSLGGITLILSFFIVLLSPKTDETVPEGSEYVLEEDGIALVPYQDLARAPALYLPSKRDILAILTLIGILVVTFLLSRFVPGTGYPMSPVNTAYLFILGVIMTGILLLVNGITTGIIPRVARDWRILGLQPPVVEGDDPRGLRERIRNPRLKKVELQPARSGLYSLVFTGLGQIYNGESEKGFLLGFFSFFLFRLNVILGLSLYLFLILDGFFTARRLGKAGRTSAWLDEVAMIWLLVLLISLTVLYGTHSLAEYFYRTEIPWNG
jgi:hypothetical protein